MVNKSRAINISNAEPSRFISHVEEIISLSFFILRVITFIKVGFGDGNHTNELY